MIFNTFKKVTSSGDTYAQVPSGGRLDFLSGSTLNVAGTFATTAAMSIGSQANTAGSGVTLSASSVGALRVFADDNGASVADSVRGIQARTLLTVDQTGGSIRSLQGQLKMLTGVDVTSGIYTALQGYVEMAGTHSAKTGSTFSCIDASMEITTALTVDSGGEAFGIHVETTGAGTITNNGTCAAIGVTKASGAAKWPIGLYVVGTDAIIGGLIGRFATSAATTSAIPFATTQDIWTDGQLSTFEVHGSSASDLTSAYCAKVGRFRHVITTSSGSVAHETYGLMGQVVVKATTLTHLHSGLIGTFEGHTSGVVLNSTYTTGGHAGVISRIGGHAAITCTTPLYGFLAWNNASAAVASGTLAAYGTAVLSTSYQWPKGLYIPSGSCTLPIDVTSSVMGAAGRIAKFYGSCAAGNMGDGYGAVETDLTLSGTVAGMVAASSTWVNVTGASVDAGSQTVCVRNDGIYVTATGTPMDGATAIIGGRLQYVAEGGGNPGALYLWQTNISDNVLTALFSVNTIEDMGGSSGAASSGGYKIPFVKFANSGTVYYINMYTS